MDPLSITTGALGIAQVAISSINQLRQTIDDISSAEKTLREIQRNLTNIEKPLNALSSLAFPDSASLTDAQTYLRETGVVEAVNHCGDACKSFNEDLQRWTRNSRSGRLSFRDRLTVGVWNKDKTRALQELVQSCQSTVQFAVQSCQLQVLSQPILHLSSRTDPQPRSLLQLRSDSARMATRTDPPSPGDESSNSSGSSSSSSAPAPLSSTTTPSLSTPAEPIPPVGVVGVAGGGGNSLLGSLAALRFERDSQRRRGLDPAPTPPSTAEEINPHTSRAPGSEGATGPVGSGDGRPPASHPAGMPQNIRDLRIGENVRTPVGIQLEAGERLREQNIIGVVIGAGSRTMVGAWRGDVSRVWDGEA